MFLSSQAIQSPSALGAGRREGTDVFEVESLEPAPLANPPSCCQRACISHPEQFLDTSCRVHRSPFAR